jgi:hypothetical protein
MTIYHQLFFLSGASQYSEPRRFDSIMRLLLVYVRPRATLLDIVVGLCGALGNTLFTGYKLLLVYVGPWATHILLSIVQLLV